MTADEIKNGLNSDSQALRLLCELVASDDFPLLVNLLYASTQIPQKEDRHGVIPLVQQHIVVRLTKLVMQPGFVPEKPTTRNPMP